MTKKIIFTLLASIFMLTISAPAFSQTSDFEPIEYQGTSHKFALMLSHSRHYQAAVMTAQRMQVKEKGYQFEIVVTGKLVKELAEDESLLETIALAEKLGVKTVLCKHAMGYLGVKEEDLDKRLLVTENAWIYMFELKDKGFNILEVS